MNVRGEIAVAEIEPIDAAKAAKRSAHETFSPR